MTVTVLVRDQAGQEVRRQRLRLDSGITASQLLARIGVPGTVRVGDRDLKPGEPVLPELEELGRREVEVRDP